MRKATRFAREGEVPQRWFVIDAAGKTLGRLSTRAAMLLMGKTKPEWSANADCGDFVVVVNAEKVRLTGKKERDKVYRWHSGYHGGTKEFSVAEWREQQPEKIIEWSIHGMLPKTRMGRKMRTHLKVYRGAEHPHAAQKPETLNF
jgi:large subunit ribosomal protein L13